jgi:hypothetical protein
LADIRCPPEYITCPVAHCIYIMELHLSREPEEVISMFFSIH